MNFKKVFTIVMVCFFCCNTSINAIGGTKKKNCGKIKVLIVDGQNNHAVWPKSTLMMKQYLEDTGLFEVEVNRTKYIWRGKQNEAFLALAQAGTYEHVEKSKTDPDFFPDFKKYDVVVSNFGFKAAPWPKKTQAAFEDFIENGGGFVAVHAANNCFPDWLNYNKMNGLGGWEGRNEKHGPYVYYNDEGKLIIDKVTKGKAGAHRARHEFPITIRKKHPITKGMPKEWKTSKDECYAKLRGPAENMTIIGTGKDVAPGAPSTHRHEPIFMVITYGKGRIFNTTLGHDQTAMEGVGFITSFTRGAEWVATGKVSQKIPKDFPTKDETSYRKFVLKK